MGRRKFDPKTETQQKKKSFFYLYDVMRKEIAHDLKALNQLDTIYAESEVIFSTKFFL